MSALGSSLGAGSGLTRGLKNVDGVGASENSADAVPLNPSAIETGVANATKASALANRDRGVRAARELLWWGLQARASALRIGVRAARELLWWGGGESGR